MQHATADIIEHFPSAASRIEGSADWRQLKLLVLSQADSRALCHGSGLRMHHLLRYLQQRHEISVLCGDNFAPAEPLRGRGRRLLAMVSPGRPYPFQPEFQRAVDRELEKQFDAVILFGAELLQYTAKIRVPVVADLVDEPVLATLRELPAERGLEFLRTVKRAVSLIPYERRWCRKMAACLLVSEENARSLTRVARGSEAVALPNGVDTDYFRPAGIPVKDGELAFTGNMSFPPNVAACLYFAQEIFPGIQREYPEVHWTIAGSDPHPSIQELSHHPGITVSGWVPDIRPYLEQAAVVVSPLISGGGIKNKVLEAWAMRKGIVATPLGCAGVEVHHEKNVLIARDASTFAAQTVRLIRDQALARALGEAGYCTVISRYAWLDKANKLETILQSSVMQAKGARRVAFAS